MLRYTQAIDGMGQPLIGVAQQSDTINNYEMVANTAQYATVPAGANLVKIGRTNGADILVLLNATSGLTWPNSNITNGSGAEANPVMLTLGGPGPLATTIGLIASVNCIITLSFFA